MWNGVFSPVLRKHRDYQHATYFEHEMDNGATLELSPDFVMVDTNPIDEAPFEPSRHYYMMDFKTHSDDRYLYLIPAEPDRSEPEAKRIRDTMDEYAKNPVEGGRDWTDYIDVESGISAQNAEWLIERNYTYGNRLNQESETDIDTRPGFW